jgi:hypothetical protein
MSSADDIREQIQKVLEPFILPREEVSYRRRILALHLASCVGEESVSSPLALVQPTHGLSVPVKARGLQREYLEALKANVSARNAYDAVKEGLSQSSASGIVSGTPCGPESGTPNPLEEHLTKIKLQTKQARLRAVEKHIDLLNQKPAACTTFLDPEEILRDTRPLPSVPKEVVDGLALADTTGKADLRDLIDRLERQVLRTKFLLKSEEQLLDAVRSRSTVRPENVDDYAKVTALNTTRTELINWMEAELSKVSGDETDEEADKTNGEEMANQVDSDHTDEQLASIRSKYAQYLVARKSLLQLVGQQPQPAMLPKTETDTEQKTTTTSTSTPVTYLLIPYLERLLSIAREQKGLITQKSHLNIAIAKQLKETVQLLDHLAEESNLLLSHPLPGSNSRRKLGFGDSLTSSESLDSSRRVKPWVYAADSSKIATLEAVAEKIEEGQVSLEGSMKALQEIDQLLGRDAATEEGAERSSMPEDDIWLTEGKAAAKAGAARKHARKPSKVGNSDDLWAFLDGGLGVLRVNED